MKVLIPLDGSKFAEDVLEPASKLASRGDENFEVHLVMVVDLADTHSMWSETPVVETIATIGVPGGTLTVPTGRGLETKDQVIERKLAEANDYLSHIAHRFFGHTAKTTVIFGRDTAAELLAHAKAERFDMIAMATHGRSGFARVMFGSVAGELLKARVAPMFIVRPDGLEEG
jgi:nucleotide-binding universal stress UspA family protein